MHCLRRIAYEVENALTILAVSHGVGLKSMHQVRKLHSIAYEEHFQVITYQIPISVFRIKFGCKTSWISQGFGRMAPMNNGRETDKYRSLLTLLLKKLSAGVF